MPARIPPTSPTTTTYWPLVGACSCTSELEAVTALEAAPTIVPSGPNTRTHEARQPEQVLVPPMRTTIPSPATAFNLHSSNPPALHSFPTRRSSDLGPPSSPGAATTGSPVLASVT